MVTIKGDPNRSTAEKQGKDVFVRYTHQVGDRTYHASLTLVQNTDRMPQGHEYLAEFNLEDLEGSEAREAVASLLERGIIFLKDVPRYKVPGDTRDPSVTISLYGKDQLGKDFLESRGHSKTGHTKSAYAFIVRYEPKNKPRNPGRSTPTTVDTVATNVMPEMSNAWNALRGRTSKDSTPLPGEHQPSEAAKYDRNTGKSQAPTAEEPAKPEATTAEPEKPKRETFEQRIQRLKREGKIR